MNPVCAEHTLGGWAWSLHHPDGRLTTGVTDDQRTAYHQIFDGVCGRPGAVGMLTHPDHPDEPAILENTGGIIVGDPEPWMTSREPRPAPEGDCR